MVYEYTKPRVPIAATYASPGPAVYNLPSLVGASSHDPRSVHAKRPAWVFGIRSGKFSEDASPGPVYLPNFKVTRFGKDGTPVYSVYGRIKSPTVFRPPGPGAYSPERAGPSAAPTSPRYSFGVRTRLRFTDSSPAPNSYTLPSQLGRTIESGKRSGPVWSQYGRSKVGGFDQDFSRTPGPGTYAVPNPDANRPKNPSYSLRPKLEQGLSDSWKPGPGAHSPERVVMTRRSAPSYSFGIRHTQYITPLIVSAEED